MLSTFWTEELILLVWCFTQWVPTELFALSQIVCPSNITFRIVSKMTTLVVLSFVAWLHIEHLRCCWSQFAMTFSTWVWRGTFFQTILSRQTNKDYSLTWPRTITRSGWQLGISHSLSLETSSGWGIRCGRIIWKLPSSFVNYMCENSRLGDWGEVLLVSKPFLERWNYFSPSSVCTISIFSMKTHSRVAYS